MKQDLREVEIERPACDYAESRGWWTCKFVAPGLRGVPDRLFIRKGQVVFIEFKAPGEVPTAQQHKRHRELRAAGVAVHWTDSLEEAKVILR